jgi:hypothetical protein
MYISDDNGSIQFSQPMFTVLLCYLESDTVRFHRARAGANSPQLLQTVSLLVIYTHIRILLPTLLSWAPLRRLRNAVIWSKELRENTMAHDAPAAGTCSLGSFLAGRLVEVGVTHAFGVPGDFNLAL